MPQFDLSSTDVNMEDFRYRGYLNSITLEEPRIPLTGPLGYKGENKTFPLKSSLIKGLPVLPPDPAKEFVYGSPREENSVENDRREKRYNLKLLEKTSADLRKIQRQQEERQQFMVEYQKKINEQKELRKREKEEDLRQLRAYNPFGKPGFGAPRGSGKENSKMTKSLQSKDGVGIVQINAKPLSASLNLPVNRPKFQRYEDDRMRRYRVDRQTAQKYKQELDALIDVKQHNQKLIEDLDKKREEGMKGYDPYGKPGAGAPNRDEFGNIKMSRKHHFSTPERFTLDENDIDKGLWGKLGQPPARSEIHFPRAGDHGIYEFVDPSIESEILPKRHIGGGGEPLVAKNGDKLTKRLGLLQTIHGARRAENVTKVVTPEELRRRVDNDRPWGKPGAGAPLKDNDGEIVKNTKGRIRHEALGYSKSEEETIERAKKIYHHELMDGIIRQQQIRDEEKSYLRLPPGDVPSWFSKGKVGRPKRDPVTGIIVPQKRIMSDVTAQKFNNDRPRDAEKYYQDLEKKAAERYQKRLEEKQRIFAQDIKHFETFNSYFQRPGNGAPGAKGIVRHKFSNNGIQPVNGKMGSAVLQYQAKPATVISALHAHNMEKQVQVKEEPKLSPTRNKKFCSLRHKGISTETLRTVWQLFNSNGKSWRKKSKFVQPKPAISLPVDLPSVTTHACKGNPCTLTTYNKDGWCKNNKAFFQALANNLVETYKKSKAKLFPHQVVAPWAVDA